MADEGLSRGGPAAERDGPAGPRDGPAAVGEGARPVDGGGSGPERDRAAFEGREAAARVLDGYARARRRVVAVLAVATPLLGAAAAGAALAGSARPLFGVFALVAPVFLAFDWIASILFLKRLAAARDEALRELAERRKG